MTDKAVIYRSHFEAIENLPEDQQLAAMKAIVRFCMDDQEPEPGTVAAAIFGMAAPILKKWKSKVEAGSKGGQANAKQLESKREANEKQTESKQEPKVESRKYKDKNIKEKQEKEKSFVPPSVEEVAEYCRSRGNDLDPEGFVAFYQSKGWKVGNNPMKDWKAAVISWEKRRKEERKQTTPSAKPRTTFHNFPQRDDAEHKANIQRLIARQS